MKKISLYLLFMCISLILDAQTYEKPKIYKTTYQKQIADKPIRFYFPDTVIKIIDNYIFYINDSTLSYYLEIQEESNGFNLLLHQRKKEFESDTISPSDLLLSSCYRYCIVNEMKIPIHFGLDIELGYYNYFITGRTLIIRLERIGYGYFKMINYSMSE